jgi:hypothetical protein
MMNGLTIEARHSKHVLRPTLVLRPILAALLLACAATDYEKSNQLLQLNNGAQEQAGELQQIPKEK